ncbi:hypothetical protein ANO11243_060820 [Dothideomycetidae sp. 11243]|nr:hypothetical protein ANO11243_060820 [fungal sp. No.11243]
MIVRESPKAKRSPDKNPSNWPPKSPYEALLSSPSGRKKWQERRDQLRERTPSPTPQRAPNRSPHATVKRLEDPFESGGEYGGEEDEDEETLQLKLQAIEAKLKLKKLQQAKAKQSEPILPPKAEHVTTTSYTSPRKRPRLNDDVQVPVSPTRIQREPVMTTSPARVILGIDKGLRAQDVSLKRARPATGSANRPDFQKTPPRIKSFTERLAESRASEIERQQKAERIQNARSQGFGLRARSESGASGMPTSLPRSQLASNVNQPSLLESARKKVGSSSGPKSVMSPSLSTASDSASRAQKSASRALRQAQTKSKANMRRPDDAETHEPFSDLHLSNRNIPQDDLESAFEGKEIYTIPRLFKEVKSPEYYPPDCEADYIVFGIISSKSSPRDITSGPKIRDSDSSSSSDKKFMVLQLTDLKWELDLFLFGTAFTRYWKLKVGTVVAILNPAIMPPRAHEKDSGRFSLKATSNGDEILELGVSRDLGFCESIRKDGTQCTTWIDTRSTQHCAFHVGLQIDQARSARMEVNTLFHSGPRTNRGGSPDGRRPGYIQSRSRAPPAKGEKTQHPAMRRDYDTKETYYMGHAFESSAVKLLDAADDLQAAERLRRRLADSEKERALQKKLGAIGTGAGAEYFRAAADKEAHRNARTQSPGKRIDSGFASARDETLAPEMKLDAASLGLIARADQVRLSPVRGRRKALYEQAEPIGWAGAFKRGLMDNSKPTPAPEAGQRRLDGILSNGANSLPRGRSESPKKARFALEKGIREPGRESLGAPMKDVADDSDDDLDII